MDSRFLRTLFLLLLLLLKQVERVGWDEWMDGER